MPLTRRRVGLLEPRVRPRGGRARLAPRARGGAPARADRRRGRDRGEQLRGRGAARGRGARRRARARCLARAARGDRRVVPRARRRRAVGRAAGGGGHHEPHAARRLRAGGRARRPAPILRAHQSNFRTVGFVEEVAIEELCAPRPAPVIDDVGSGALAERLPELADEPPVRRSVAAGLRGRLLLGRQAAGRPAGGPDGRARATAIERCRAHPLARARCGSTSSRSPRSRRRCASTAIPARALREVPVLRMLAARRGGAAARARSGCARRCGERAPR